jgi:hypothetical protein
MNINVPSEFYHSGDLPQAQAGRDPRNLEFRATELNVDMRNCGFIRPAAVLWCGVYPLLALARGVRTRLVVPENQGVCVYLQSVGLFAMLKDAGVEVDDRNIGRRSDPRVILPLARFSTEFQVEQIANDAQEHLMASEFAAPNLNSLVSETFAELALNAVQHSESEFGSLGFIQFYQTDRGSRFVCCVADGGVGIRRSLEKNPAIREQIFYDWDAIELALKERVSGTGSPTRGIGLFGIAEDMRRAGRQLIIHSGIGMLTTSEDVQRSSVRTGLFPGTLAYASIPAEAGSP